MFIASQMCFARNKNITCRSFNGSDEVVATWLRNAQNMRKAYLNLNYICVDILLLKISRHLLRHSYVCLSVGQEGQNGAIEVAWTIKHTDVASLWEDDETRMGKLFLQNVPQRERDQRIVLAPEQQRRSGHGGDLLAYIQRDQGAERAQQGHGSSAQEIV
jgi:hypothetical protein